MRLRKKLVQRLVVLAAGLAVVGAVIGGYATWRLRQIRLSFAADRQKGILAARAGDDQTAIQLLERYARRYPLDADVLSLYARSRSRVELPNNGHIREAVLALRHLLQLDPHRTADRLLLLDLYVRAGYATEALDVADSLLPSDPKAYRSADATALSARTQALRWLGRYGEALETARRWSSAAPADLDAHLAVLSLLYQAQRRGPELTETGDRLAEAARRAVPPGDPRPEMVRGYAQFLAGSRDSAVQTLRGAAGHVGSNPQVIRTLAQRFDELGLAEDALAVLSKLPAASLDPRDGADLTRRSWELGRGAEAAKASAALDKADPKTDAELLGIRALSLCQVASTNDAAAIRDTLAGRSNDPLATAWAAVIDYTTNTRQQRARPTLDACRAALQVRPDDPYLRYFFGDACAALGERDLALESWRKAVEDDPRWAAPLVRMADALSQAGQHDAAVLAAREAFRRAPHLPAVAIVAAQAWAAGLESGRLEGSDDLLRFANEIQDQFKTEPVTLCIRVTLLARSHREDQARALLRQTLAGKPIPPESTLIRLATVSRAYRLQMEDQILDCCERAHGLTPSLVYQRATCLAEAGKAADGLRLFDVAHPLADDTRWQVVRAQYLDEVGDGHALEAVVKCAETFPHDLGAQELALSAHCARGDREFRQHTIGRFREIIGEDAVRWRLEQARWLLDFEPTPEAAADAARLLQDVIHRAPSSLEARLLLADAAEARHRISEAIDQLTEATALDPASSQLPLRLARLLQSQGEFDKARQQLEKVAGERGASGDVRTETARLYAAGGDVQQAIDLLEERPAESSLSTQARLLLAGLYREQGKLAKAEATCRPLLDKPEPAAVALAAEVLASQGRTADAKELLRRLDGSGADSAVRYLVRAEFAARFEGADQGLTLYRKATEAAPSDPKVWKALISAIAASGRAADLQAAVDQALRALPAEGAFQSLRQNTLLLTRALPDASLRQIVSGYVADPSDTAPLELLRLLFPDQRGRPPADQLVQPLQQLIDRFPSFLPARIVLTSLQAGLGRTDDAIETATHAAQRFPTSAEPLRLKFSLLSAINRWEEAATAASAWRERAADSPEAADLALAMAELHTAHSAEAEQRLESYIKLPEADRPRTSDQDEALAVYAAARLANGHGPVEPLLEGLLTRGAEGRRTWIVFALDHLSTADAAVWLRKSQAITPASSTDEQIFLARAWDTLATRANSAEYAAESRSVLTSLVARQDASAGALVAMGMRCEQDGDAIAAEVFYRRALRASPRLAVAQNNLAMLLARGGRNLDEARELSAAAVQETPNAAAFYDTLGYVQSKSGKYTEAVQSMETAVRIDTTSVPYRVHLAQLLADARQTEKATAILRGIDALHPDRDRLPEPTQGQLDSLRRALGKVNQQGSVR